MAAFSDYLEAAILNATLRGVTFPTPPASVYLALFTSSPTDNNTTTGELTTLNSPGYARVQVTPAGWSAPAAGSGASTSSNSNALEFPEATNNWAGPITHFGIYDAASGGNLLYHGALASSRTIGTGDVLRFSAGALAVSVA